MDAAKAIRSSSVTGVRHGVVIEAPMPRNILGKDWILWYYLWSQYELMTGRAFLCFHETSSQEAESHICQL
jgi:hypothetical protein